MKRKDKLGYYHLDGEKFWEYIRLLSKYYKTSDVDYLDKVYNIRDELFEGVPYQHKNVCTNFIGTYLNWNKLYTSSEERDAKILSLASLAGFKVD